MKFRNLSLVLLSAVAVLSGCKKETKELGAPNVSLSSAIMEFEQAIGSKTFELTATRDWKAEFNADWLTVEPKSGKGSADAQKIKVTVVENKGFDREASVKFNIGFASKTLTVKQKGSGSATDALVYYNNFDKELTIKKKWGSSTYDGYPFLDQFDGWKNAQGKGIANVEYNFKGVSLRTAKNHNSDSGDSDYNGSGKNSLWFGTDGFFEVKSITLLQTRDYILSFGAERSEYKQGETIDNTFKPEEFPVYISNDGTKWIKVGYSFPNGNKNNRWDIASFKFTLPSGTDKLFICIKPTVASAYKFDDLKLESGTDAGAVIDFSKGVELNLGGETPTPGPTVTGTLAQLAAAADNSTVKTNEVLVVAKAKNAVLVEEGSDYLLVYNAKACAVGDKVVVTGIKNTYNGSAQVGTKDAAPVIEVKSSGNAVSHPTAKVLNGAAFDAYASTKVEMVSFKGALSISGAYYNVAVDGAGTKTGSLVAPLDELIPADANGKTVEVSGYYLYTSQGKYISIIVVSATVSGEGPAQIDPEKLKSNVTWALGNKAYDEEAFINGSKDKIKVLKLGTGGKKAKQGNAKITLKKGTTKVNFFAVAWNNEKTTLVIKKGSDVVAEQAVRANAGFAGSSPYKIVVDSEKDRYSITLPPLADDTEFSVTTKDGEKFRVALFGIQAE